MFEEDSLPSPLLGNYSKKVINYAVLSILLYAFFELTSLFGIYLIKRIYNKDYNPTLVDSISDKHKERFQLLFTEHKSHYGRHSQELGWDINKNASSALANSNSQGIRGNKDYSLIPSNGIVCLSTFGDSYTHGDGVGNEDTWQERLNNLASNIEVLNFGVNGYGLDQSFLRYQRDGIKFNSHIVLIGFLSENILRNLNVFRPFYMPKTGVPLGKPYFTLSEDNLLLNPNPFQELSDYKNLLDKPGEMLPILGKYDYFYNTPDIRQGFAMLLLNSRFY